MTGIRSRRCSARGSVLLELVIALAIFSIAVIGLARTLNGSMEVSNILNKDHRVRVGMRSFLEEVRRKPLAEMSVSMTDAVTGITYASSLQPITLNSTSGSPLQDLYNLKVIASYSVGNEIREESVDVYVYKPAHN